MFKFGRRLSSYAAEMPAKIGHDLLDTLLIIANYIFTISATATRNRLVIHPPGAQQLADSMAKSGHVRKVPGLPSV